MENDQNNKGLTVMGAAVLIAGEMGGSGVLALPKAVVDSGWIGLIMMVVFCINSSYGGTRLGKCWEILEERHPKYKGSSRAPYPVIAEAALGTFGRYLASICIWITLFGAGTVYLLQASQIVQELLKDVWPNVTYCIWLLIFAALITPPMWLGSPKDFWFVGIAALLTTAMSCILILVQIILDGLRRQGKTQHEEHGLMDFFISFGVILFAFGGASTFPTIQNDMTSRNKFTTSVCIGYAFILLIYLPVAVGGYLIYGEETKTNILLSLKRSSLTTMANVLLASHFVMAILILVNPVCQEIENILKIPKKFTIKRCISRTAVVCLMIFAGESVPDFGKILALIGASTVTLLTFILPNLMYIILCNQEYPGIKKRDIPWYFRVYMFLLIGIGVFGGVAASYSALMAIFSTNTFIMPCYWP